MKQKQVAAIIIGLTGIFCLLLFSFIPTNLLLLFPILILTTASCLYLMYHSMICRIEKLDGEVRNVTENHSLNERIRIKNTGDEVSVMADNINLLLGNIQTLSQRKESEANESAKKLEEMNIHLQQEISARSRTEKMVVNRDYLMQLGKNDEITSLPNGIQFNEILVKSIIHSRRRQQTLAILLVNLDLFKLVQDTFGQSNGNLILQEMSKRIQNVLRKEDVLAKLDGDEFIILLNDIAKPKYASMVARKILNTCSALLKVDTQEFTITASIGISIYPNDGMSLEEILENADRALFKAKQAGGNVYQFHADEIQTEAVEYIQLETALRKAIHNNELALYYQPKFRLTTGKITAVEGLMRWEHPTLGIISPAKFIPLAEESGMIMQIGEWALHEACQRISYWQNEGFEHITVALKLSHKQFNHPDMVKMLKNVLSNYKINPEYIELEITEKTVMENVEAAAAILDKIRETGVQLSIDHFGTGYTVISYLKQFPLAAIKIDQSYIRGIPNNPNDVAITSALIALAHQLGLEVVAEGVENPEQIQFLTAQNCDVVQGYFLSHPVSAQKIVQQFRKLQDEVLG